MLNQLFYTIIYSLKLYKVLMLTKHPCYRKKAMGESRVLTFREKKRV